MVRKHKIALLVFSLVAFHLLAPSLNQNERLVISATFALILILSSGVIVDKIHVRKYLIYLFISIFTYHILFEDQPWNFLMHGGLMDSSAVPLIVCSIIMSLAGGLLLEKKRQWFIYIFITLGLQIPIGLIIGNDSVVELLNRLYDRFELSEDYAGVWKIWQYEWMMTYYLPIYFFGRNKLYRA